MENSMKIANKFSHFHSAPQFMCVCVYLCVMFIFYGFRPQCVRCNNYTTQSTQKEPRGSTSTNKKVARTNKNASKTHLFPLTVGISCNRCRKKRNHVSCGFCINFIIYRLVMYLAKSPALTSYGQWSWSGKCWVSHWRMEDDGLAFKWENHSGETLS